MQNSYRFSMLITLLAVFILALAGCTADQLMVQPQTQESASGDGMVDITIMHTNDIYEILPVSGGKLGGLSRLATLKQQMLAENPNTLLFFSGDLYGPSGMSTAVVDGLPLEGIQAVEVINKVGIDYMVLGDHEINRVDHEENFLRNLAETEFPMLSSNVFDADGQPFASGDTTVAVNDILVVTDEDGDEVKIGLFGIIKPIGRAGIPYSEKDGLETTAEQVALLSDQVDILIALTHHGIENDVEMGNQFPEIDLILGADEHKNSRTVTDNALIYKADSNARSAYIINLSYDTTNSEMQIEDYLQEITDEIAEDPETLKVADEWTQIAFDAFRAEGIDPTEVVVRTPIELDGFAGSIRSQPTELTKLIVSGMYAVDSEADGVLQVTGLLRMDDLIPADSDVTFYDVIRNIPASPPLVSVELSGEILKTLLDNGRASSGQGGFVQVSENIRYENDNWLHDEQPLDITGTYRVVTSQMGYDFFSRAVELPEPEVHEATLRDAMVNQLNVAFGTE